VPPLAPFDTGGALLTEDRVFEKIAKVVALKLAWKPRTRGRAASRIA